MVREIVRESSGGGGGGGAVTYPMLTKTNYTEWATIMRVKMQGAFLWEAVETGAGPVHKERKALGVILSSVLPEMVPVLAKTDNTKDAWDAINKMCIGIDRVREARRQRLRKDRKSVV